MHAGVSPDKGRIKVNSDIITRGFAERCGRARIWMKEEKEGLGEKWDREYRRWDFSG
jgi:hypothetical protein